MMMMMMMFKSCMGLSDRYTNYMDEDDVVCIVLLKQKRRIVHNGFFPE